MTREHGEVVKSTVIARTCDRCKTRYTDSMELQEFLKINKTAGYASIFGDMNSLDLDLCQYCVRATLGPWLLVADPVPLEPRPRSQRLVEWHEHIFANPSHDRTEEEELYDRIDVIKYEGSPHYTIYDPGTDSTSFSFSDCDRAIEFAKQLVQKIKR